MSIFDTLGETVDPEKNYLEELVGEGKKYKDEAALARAVMESQLHIKKIEAENAEQREQIQKQVTMEEVLDQVRQISSENPKGTPPEEGMNKSETNPVDVEATVRQLLTQRETEQRRQANLRLVQEELGKRFGGSAGAELKKKAAQLGMSDDQLTKLAEENPNILLELVGKREETPSPTLPEGSVTTPSTGGLVRNRKYYEEMKKNDPKKYFSDATRVQMMKDAVALKSKFDE